MIREMDHTLDARAEPESACLFQRDGFTVRNSNLTRRRYRSEAAGKQQQLAPRIDQQRYLVIDLEIKNKPIKSMALFTDFSLLCDVPRTRNSLMTFVGL